MSCNKLILFLVLFFYGSAQAQYPWSGILNPSRAIDWSTAGIPGGIPNVTVQCGLTVQPNGTDDTSSIQNALNGCSSTTTNSYLQLAAGTFYTFGAVNIPNHVTLRGMGADQTIIQMDQNQNNSSGVNGYAFTLGPLGNQQGTSYSRTMKIVSNNSRGDTTITVGPPNPGLSPLFSADPALLAVKDMVWIADLNDWFGIAPAGAGPSCAGYPDPIPAGSRCINTASDIELSNPGGSTAGNMDGSSSLKSWGQRAAGQMNLITGLSGSTITLQDPLVDSFRHPLPDWVANSPTNPIHGFNRGMAIQPSGSTHVYVQNASTQLYAPGYCRTAANPPSWPTDGSSVTEIVSNLASVPCAAGLTCTEVACAWSDHGVGTDTMPRLMYWVPFTNVGLENLQIYGVNNMRWGNFQSLVHMIDCLYCWIRGVEINRPLNFIIKTEYSYHGQIEQNFFTTAWYHGSGDDTVIDVDGGTTGFLIQNNIFERTAEAIFTDNGGSGNVIAYNYSIGTWGSNSLNGPNAQHISHDAFPWFNLLEGNIMNGMTEDGIHGGNGYGTKFRNWSRMTSLICQPVSVTGLNGGVPTKPPAPTATVPTPGSTSYYYTVELVVAGAQSVPSLGITVTNGPPTLSSGTPINIRAPNCPTVATCVTNSTTAVPNAPTDRCLIFRCTSSACAAGSTQIGSIPCDAVTPLPDTGQASQGVGSGQSGAGGSFVPSTITSCSPRIPNNTTSVTPPGNSWFGYQGVWNNQHGQYTTSFNNVGNVTGSQNLMTVSLEQKQPEHRKACGICDSNCADNSGTVSCTTPTTAGTTCPLVTCGTATSRNYSWLIDENYGIGTGTICNPATTVCHDTTLAQDTAFHCLNYFHSLDTTESGQPIEVGDCPSNTVLPPSFYLVGKPSWWGSAHWPAIGSDLTGGLAQSYGHAYNIPAKNCYENVMGGSDSTGAPFLKFNAAACYSSAPIPLVTQFSLTPSNIQLGGSSILTWATSNADTVSIDQGIGSVLASDSRSISPSTTTTYTLTAINTNGSNGATATLTVATIPPPVFPNTINGIGTINGSGVVQ